METSRGKIRFDHENQEDVRAYLLMCHRKANWFSEHHFKILQARFFAKCLAEKSGSDFQSVASVATQNDACMRMYESRDCI